jgi:hypothetical protein
MASCIARRSSACSPGQALKRFHALRYRLTCGPYAAKHLGVLQFQLGNHAHQLVDLLLVAKTHKVMLDFL